MDLLTLCVAFLTSFAIGNCKDCTDQACLSNLYNSDVKYAELYTRALGCTSPTFCGSPGSLGNDVTGLLMKYMCFVYNICHAGVVVTLRSNEQWLIHKGSGFGHSSSTVITDAGYMEPGWTLQGSSAVSGRTVNDFMRAALIDKDYHWYGTNCITAAIRMWFLVDKPFNLK